MTNKHELVATNEIVTIPSAPTGIDGGYNASFYPIGNDFQYQQGPPYRQYLLQAKNVTNFDELNKGGLMGEDSMLGTNYRINKIGEYVKYLDSELKDRERLKKSYGKFDKTLFGIECTCMVTELGITGTSFVLPPLVLISTPICLGLTILSAFLRNGSKMLTRKIDKHSSIELLARSKRNSIDEKYTKAMEDGKISDLEFQDIRKEISNYDEMKKNILNSFKKGGPEIAELTREAQMSLINKGKAEMKEELKTKLMAS
jgi:hypothetical protein